MPTWRTCATSQSGSVRQPSSIGSRSISVPTTEAVVIGGNGFRAAPAIRALEARSRRLVLEANQVMLWSALSGARAAPPIRGFGKLFSTPKEKEAGHA